VKKSWVTPEVLTEAAAYAEICASASINKLLTNKLQTSGKRTQRLKSLLKPIMHLQDILTELVFQFHYL